MFTFYFLNVIRGFKILLHDISLVLMGQLELYILLNSTITMSNFSQNSTLAVKRGKYNVNLVNRSTIRLIQISEWSLNSDFTFIFWRFKGKTTKVIRWWVIWVSEKIPDWGSDDISDQIWSIIVPFPSGVLRVGIDICGTN